MYSFICTFSYISFCFMYCNSLQFGVYLLKICIYSKWIHPFIIMQYPSLALLIFFAPKSTTANINIIILGFVSQRLYGILFPSHYIQHIYVIVVEVSFLLTAYYWLMRFCLFVFVCLNIKIPFILILPFTKQAYIGMSILEVYVKLQKIQLSQFFPSFIEI